MATKTTKGAAPSPKTGAPQPFDWQSTGVSGFESTRQEDLGRPFLAIIQSGSPQIKKTDPNYATKKIEGAGEGDIINNLSNTVVYTQGEDELLFVPCFHERLFVEWAPRASGGGMVKMHRTAAVLNETTKNEKNQDILKNGNLIVTTSYFYGLILKDEEEIPVVIGMSSTQLKKARAWLNTMSSIKFDGRNGKFTPPMFSHIYGITTVPESNNDGSWFGWHIELHEPVQKPKLIERCMTMAREAAQSSQLALPAPAKTEDDNVPFA